MSLLKKLASETALYGLSSIVGRLVTFVFLTPYLTRRFEPTEMGVQTDMYAYAAFLAVVFSYRLETSLFRFGTAPENRAQTFNTSLTSAYLSTFCLCAGLILFAQPLAGLLEYPDKPEYVIFFALIIAADALAALPFARLRLEGKAKRFAGIKLANLGVQIGAILLLLEVFPSTGDPVSKLFLANLCASGATLLFLFPQIRYFKRLLPPKPTDSPTSNPQSLIPNLQSSTDGAYSVSSAHQPAHRFYPDIFKKILLYALPLTLASFAGIINEVLDRILLKNLLTGDINTRLYELGIYGACYKISIFMNLFTQAFNYAAEPFFFKQAGKENSKQIYADVTYLFVLVACMGFVGLTVFSDITQYFVSAPYRVGMGVVPILLLANLCLGIYYNLAVWYKLGDKTQWGAYIGLFGAGMTIGLNYLLIPSMGYMGAAWATLGCYASMCLVAYAAGQNYYPIPYPSLKIILHIVGAIGAYFVSLWVKANLSSGFWAAQFLSLLIFLGYVGIILLVERSNLRAVIKRT